MTPHALRLRAAIEAAYEASGNELGWRFLASPAAVLDGADVAFIGLNPGGRVDRADHADFAMPSGSAYVDEIWPPALAAGGHPLQRQVVQLFEMLGVAPSAVLAGNLVPFRSPDWLSLKNPGMALRFGEDLWCETLGRARPRLVVVMGRVVFSAMQRVLKCEPTMPVPIGWGRVTALRANYEEGMLVGLPHLSRFGIFGRSQSQPALRQLFGAG